MGNPADLRIDTSRVRRFTPDEANAVVDNLESIFLRMDPALARVRELRDLLDDLEAYYGPDLADAPSEDRDAREALISELAEARAYIDACVAEILALGAEVKDVRLGLVDFYAQMGEDVVYLCWQRGEPRVAHWHTLEAGYAGRKPLGARPRAEP